MGWEMNHSPEEEVVWRSGYSAGYRVGMGHTIQEHNPYEPNTWEHRVWKEGATQGYQDS